MRLPLLAGSRKRQMPEPIYILGDYPTDLGWAFRRIYPGAQYCCRIRNGDMAEIDIGFRATPIVINGRTVYLMDEGAAVAHAMSSALNTGYAWITRVYIQDRAVNNVLYLSQTNTDDNPYIVVTGAVIRDPVTNMPAMTIDGVSDYMNLPNAAWANSIGYIMHAIVGRIVNTGSTAVGALVAYTGSSSSVNRYVVRQSATANKAGMSLRRTGAASNVNLTATSTHDGLPHVWTGYADFANNVSELRQDGATEATGSTGTSGLTTSGTTAYLGKSGSDIYIQAYISEMLMWNVNTYAGNLTNEIESDLMQVYLGG